MVPTQVGGLVEEGERVVEEVRGKGPGRIQRGGWQENSAPGCLALNSDALILEDVVLSLLGRAEHLGEPQRSLPQRDA